MEITTVSTLLGTLKTATDIAKFIKDSDVTLEKAEVKLKLADLISALAEARIEVTEVQQALVAKEAELRAFQEMLNVKSKLQWESPYYWLIDGSRKDGPYCQHCYDKDEKLIRLQGNGEGYWECKVCGNGYTDSTYRPYSGSFEPDHGGF